MKISIAALFLLFFLPAAAQDMNALFHQGIGAVEEAG